MFKTRPVAEIDRCFWIVSINVISSGVKHPPLDKRTITSIFEASSVIASPALAQGVTFKTNLLLYHPISKGLKPCEKERPHAG